MSRFPLVGRTAALAQLDDALAAGRRSAGGLVLLTGEPGIGKTRLAEEVADRARDFRVVWCRCDPAAAAPYRPWLRLLTAVGGDPATLSGGADAYDATADRFEAFDRVIDQLAMASADRPLLVIFDDVHDADPSSLELLIHAATQLKGAGTVLLATARDAESAWHGRLASWAELLRASRILALTPLSVDEVGELMIGSGQPVPPDTLRAVASRTDGNPLLVTELVGYLRAHHRLGDPMTVLGVPSSVRALVAGQLARWSPAEVEATRVAATLGSRCSPDLLAGLLAAELTEVDGWLRPARAAGVLDRDETGEWRFSHDLVRDAVYDEIDLTEQRRLHAAVAAGLARRSADPAMIAHHLMRAGPEHAMAAADQAVAAARVAEEVGAYEDAAQWYAHAVEIAERDPEVPDIAVRLAYGRALLASGDRATARVTLLTAGAAARAAGEPVALARAALALAGPAGFEVSLLDADQVGLLADARDALPAGELALRALVAARLSVALTDLADDGRRRMLADEAAELARSSGDRAALAEALAGRCDAFAGPEAVADRLGWSAELLTIAEEVRSSSLELLGRRLRLVCLLELGDLRAADAEITAYAVTADRLRHPLPAWYPSLWRAMQALADGRIGDCELLAREAAERGRRAGSQNAAVLVMTLRWILAGEVGDPVRLAAVDGLAGLRTTPNAWAAVSLGFHHRQLGDQHQARTWLATAAARVPGAPRDSEWLPMMTQFAELVAGLGGHPMAGWAYQALRPYADLLVVEGIGAVLRGPVERPLGLLAAAGGHPAAARGHFERAIGRCRELGATMLLARALYDGGQTVDDPDWRAEAAELYRSIGCGPPLPSAAGPPASAATGEPNAFRREQDVWSLRYAGQEIRLRDSKGLRDLARLLSQPGRAVAALELAGATGSSRRPGDDGLHEQGDIGEVIDATARSAYRRRLVELDDDAREADAAGDPERSEAVAAEREALIAQLSAAYGLGGRIRRTGHPAERARTAVTARIKDSLRRIDAAHPELGRHLTRSVRTGTFCSYEPERPVNWQL